MARAYVKARRVMLALDVDWRVLTVQLLFSSIRWRRRWPRTRFWCQTAAEAGLVVLRGVVMPRDGTACVDDTQHVDEPRRRHGLLPSRVFVGSHTQLRLPPHTSVRGYFCFCRRFAGILLVRGE